MFEVTRKRRTKITATCPRGFAAHRLGTTGAEEKRRFVLDDNNETRRLAFILSIPVNLHMSTHFSKHIIFLHLRPLNFKPRFKVIQHNQLNRWVQFAAGSRVAYHSYKALISSGAHPLSYQIGTGSFFPNIKQAAIKVITHIPPVSKLRNRATQTFPLALLHGVSRDKFYSFLQRHLLANRTTEEEMEGRISFWGYKEQESNLILLEHDDDDDDIYIYIYLFTSRCLKVFYEKYFTSRHWNTAGLDIDKTDTCRRSWN
jgi:hypothetical protein